MKKILGLIGLFWGMLAGAQIPYTSYPQIGTLTGSENVLINSGSNLYLTTTSKIAALGGGGGGGGSTSWSSITGGINTLTSMYIGNGSSLGTTGTGILSANEINGVSIAGLGTGLLYNTSGTLSLATAANVYGVFGCTGNVNTFLNGGGGCSTPPGGGNVSNSGSPAQYQLPVWTASTILGSLATGSSGQALVSQGASNYPLFSSTLAGVTSVNGTSIPASTTLSTFISGTPSSATVIATYSPASFPNAAVQTSDMGLLINDGARWMAQAPPIPLGAAQLGYTKNVYTVFPTTNDITYTITNPPKTRLYSGNYPLFSGYGLPPSSAYSTASNGQLGIQYPAGGPVTAASLVTTEVGTNSATLSPNLGYLPFLVAGQGFYTEIAVTLSGNNTDNWFAYFLDPQEHNSYQVDQAPNDPAAYERWIEFDVNENGHGSDYSGAYRGAIVSWLGYYSKPCVFTAALTGTSGTIATNGVNGSYSVWPGDSGTYNLTTSTSQLLTATFTKGSAAVTWTPTVTGSPTANATCGYGRTISGNIQTATLDYTTEHIFGMSYDPVKQQAIFYQDGVQQSTVSTANASAAINAFHYYPIIVMQSHSAQLAFTGTVRYFSAWTTGTPNQTVCVPNEQAGSTYTVAATDNACNVVFSNATSTAVTLPAATNISSGLGGGFSSTLQAAYGAGTVTVTPSSPSTINGVASITLNAPYACRVLSDGSNWTANCTGAGGAINSGAAGQVGYYATSGTTISAASVGGNLILNSGTLQTSQPINAQTGTTYTIATTDAGKLLTFNNGSANAVSLPSAATLGSGFSFDAQNINTGLVTITPASGTVNGQSSLSLMYGEGCTVSSDGTNYQISACPSALRQGTFLGVASGTGACATTSTVTAVTYKGKFTCTGTTGISTVTITLPSAPNGYVCSGNDTTTSHYTALYQTASTTSSCTLGAASVTANDVLNFNASPY